MKAKDELTKLDDTDMTVAIKACRRPSQSTVYAARLYRELRILKHMQHENVIGLVDCFTPEADLMRFSSVYLVTHFVEGSDLRNIMRVNPLTDDHVEYILYQIVRGLKYIHSAGITHGDLKPSNIVINENCELKIFDFGYLHDFDDDDDHYVVNRWYKAPEIMLKMCQNGYMDIWAVGLIAAEILTGKPLFPGNDIIDQLTKIVSLCGSPSDSVITRIPNANIRTYWRSNIPTFDRKDFSTIFNSENTLLLDLLDKILQFNPEDRLDVNAVIGHSYFAEYRDPDDEPTAPLYVPAYDNCQFTVDTWKEKIWEEVSAYM
jgi:p38 MAP kinase